MRFLSLLLPLTLLASPAMAQSGSNSTKSLKDVLPSEAEVEQIIAELPDFNHMMDGLMDIAQDEKLQKQFKDSAEHMKEQLEESGALEPRDNGLPDFNAAMAVMLRTFTDKDGVGGMIEALEDVSKDFESIVEESFDKSGSKKSGKKTPLNDSLPKANTGLTDI